MGAWNSVVNAFCRRLAREHRSYALLSSLNRWGGAVLLVRLDAIVVQPVIEDRIINDIHL